MVGKVLQSPCALYRLCLFVGLLLCAFSLPLAFAEDRDVLRVSLGEAVQAALKANLKLNIGQYTLQKVRIDRNSSWFVFVPRLSLSASYVKNDKKPQSSLKNPSASQTSLSATVSSLSINITDMLSKDVITVLRSVQDYNAQKITFEKLIFDTAVETQKLYFDLLIAQKKLHLLKEQRTVSEVDSQEAESAYKAGLKDEYAMLKTKLAFLKSQQAYDTQVNTEAKVRRSLLVVMGHEDMESQVSLADDIPDVSQFDIESILALRSVNNADIAAQHVSLKSLQLQRWSAAFDYLPSLSLSYSFLSSTRLQNVDGKNWFDGKNWKSKDDKSLTLTVSIDVTKYLPWSPSSVALRKLNASIKAKDIEITQLAISNENSLEALKSKLKLLLKRLKDNATEVRIAERSSELAQEGYKNGLIAVKEYLTTKADLHDAYIKRITQQAEVVKLILTIKALVNDKNGVY